VLQLSGCATQSNLKNRDVSTGLLFDYSKLKPTQIENYSLYRADQFNRAAYAAVITASPIVSSKSSNIQKLSSDMQSELLNQVESETKALILKSSVVGSKALIFRAAVIDVETPNRALNVLTTLLIGPLTSGGASIEMTISDQFSGELLMAALCTESASAIWQLSGAYSVIAHANHSIKVCIQRFSESLL
jgi:hypothetical protein